MAGSVLNIQNIISPDQLGTEISRRWMEWSQGRATKVEQWKEVRKYVYATDTSTTSNSSLPWKNKTTLPKLCQIRDNLSANYIAALFPRRKWLTWEASDEESNSEEKRQAIENYANYITKNPEFKKEVTKIIFDYIDYGNAIAIPEWVDQRIVTDEGLKVGYVGPMIRRISPNDIVFNPVADDFTKSPKIIRSLVSMGEVKAMLEQTSPDENLDAWEELWDYLVNLRQTAANIGATSRTGGVDNQLKEDYYRVDGFQSYSYYLDSGYVELLAFYGDIYDYDSKQYLRNHIVIVADRHKVLVKKPHPSVFGHAPIFHVGWRPRQDNLWAMGPLDNLVGMQYRLDHVENLKADVFDLLTFPPLKVKGYVEDFEWGPFEKIHTGDSGDVEILAPPFQILQTNIEIQAIEARMEEMAGAPKEAMGIRTPGEKTAFEVQRLESAAGRIFQNKTSQFEELLLEPLINACIELARRNLDSTQVSVFDDEFNFQTFQTITNQDLSGNGKIRPIAARNFAEKATRVQNLTQLMSSAIGADPDVKVHMSSFKLAKLMEDWLDLADYEIVQPYVRLSEQKEAQSLMQVNRENAMMEMQTPSGLTPDQYDADLGAGGMQGMPGQPQ